MKPYRFFFAFYFAMINGLAFGSAEAGNQKRVILSFWSSRYSNDHYNSSVLRHVESVLNHLGLYVDYVDIDTQALPDVMAADFKEKYRGVLTMFEEEYIPSTSKLLDWLGDYVELNLPWVHLGYFGFLGVENKEKLEHFFSKLGVRYSGLHDPPMFPRVLIEEGASVHFERTLSRLRWVYPPVAAIGTPSNPVRHWVKLSYQIYEQEGSAIFFSPRLSVAYGDYALFSDDKKDRRQWQIDPFRFFEEAFGIDRRIPVPDVSVVNGRRLFYTHIDGDAFNSTSQIDPKLYCGEMMEDRIVKRYPLIPFGVSIIVAEVNLKSGANRRLAESASRLLQLPNVEPASHSYHHPLDWKKAETSYPLIAGTFNSYREVVDSIRYVQQNLSGSKPVQMLYWSGNCMPEAETLGFLEANGFLNLNGGDGRFDSNYPSISYLSPLGRPVGPFFQVFSSNANEYLYTNEWKGPFSGFLKVIETFEKTAAPLLLKPINPYFHFYSAEREESLSAVAEVLEWAQGQPIAPVFPSEYVRMVLAFRNSQILEVAPWHYTVIQNRGVRTLRVDRPEDRVPDFERSSGIIGYTYLNGSLYLHVAPEAQKIEILLIPKKSMKQSSPYIDSVGGVLNSWSPSNDAISFELGSFAKAPLLVGGISTGALKVSIDGVVAKSRAINGLVEIDFKSSQQPQRVELHF